MLLRPGVSTFLLWQLFLARCIWVCSLRAHHDKETDFSVTASGIAIHRRIANESSPSPSVSQLESSASSPMSGVQLVVGSQAARNSTHDELNRHVEMMSPRALGVEEEWSFRRWSRGVLGLTTSWLQTASSEDHKMPPRHTATAFISVKQGVHTLVSTLAKPFRAELLLLQPDTGSSDTFSFGSKVAFGAFFLCGVACCASMCMNADVAKETERDEDNAPASDADDEVEQKVGSKFASAFKKGAKHTGSAAKAIGTASLGLSSGLFSGISRLRPGGKSRDEIDKDDASKNDDSDCDVSNYY